MHIVARIPGRLLALLGLAVTVYGYATLSDLACIAGFGIILTALLCTDHVSEKKQRRHRALQNGAVKDVDHEAAVTLIVDAYRLMSTAQVLYVTDDGKALLVVAQNKDVYRIDGRGIERMNGYKFLSVKANTNNVKQDQNKRNNPQGKNSSDNRGQQQKQADAQRIDKRGMDQPPPLSTDELEQQEMRM